MKVGDLEFLPRNKRFVISMNRFAWEAVPGGCANAAERRLSVLHFDRVLSVKTAGHRPAQARRSAVASGSPLRAGRGARRHGRARLFRRRHDPARCRVHRGVTCRSWRRLGGIVTTDPSKPDPALQWQSRSITPTPISKHGLPHFLTTKREVSEDVDQRSCTRLSSGFAPRAMQRLIDYSLHSTMPTLRRWALRSHVRISSAAYAAAEPETVEALKLARDRIRAASRAADAAGRSLHRSRSASNLARAGRRSNWLGSMCRAALQAIRVPC